LKPPTSICLGFSHRTKSKKCLLESMYDRPSCSDWLNSGKSCPVLYWLRTVLWEGYTDHPENDPMFFSPRRLAHMFLSQNGAGISPYLAVRSMIDLIQIWKWWEMMIY
jgi:hypothetical protein